MPVVKITTAIPSEKKRVFERKRQELGLSEYKLAQTAILTFIEEPNVKEKTLFERFLEAYSKLP